MLLFAKENSLGRVVFMQLPFQTSSHMRTVDPSPGTHVAIRLKFSESLLISFHQKDPFSGEA
uniref:Uncharacterized protein n=1 Tax=Arundo donax TaxID=35708 RepID=A0A0A8XVW9_ARUDO